MNWTLEVVAVPVTDVDRAKDFYVDGLGFGIDHDTELPGGGRLVQLTPPGSGCSIILGDPVQGMEPGSLKGTMLVVSDLRKARKELVDRGVDVSEIVVMGKNGPYEDGDELNNVGFLNLSDPDGNGWAIQQIDNRD